MPLTAGTRIGPYEIVDSIGAGGMGEVYRDVAIKVLPATVAQHPDRLAFRARGQGAGRAQSSQHRQHSRPR